jgi:hypothetical protein
VLNDPSQTHYKDLLELGLTSEAARPMSKDADGKGVNSWDSEIERMRNEVASNK